LYFGSVRFFKNLIFIAVCILIMIPSLLAVKFYRQAVRSAAPQTETTESVEPTAPEQTEPAKPTEPAEPGQPQPVGVYEPEGVPELTEPEPPADPIEPDAQPNEAVLPPSADPPDYEQLYPDFYAPQPYHATERVENTIYLTFDDGPSERTDEILKVLAEKNVKATFFVVGQSDPANLARMRKIVEAGHTIGMHSFSHSYAEVYTSVESFLDEFHRNFVQIQEATGVTPTVFRFPGGSINGYDGGFYQEVLSEMIRRGFVPFDWNISSEDAVGSQKTAQAIVDQVVSSAEGKVRGFVLFHDTSSKTSTAAAIGPVIDRLRAMGFTFSEITPSTMPVLYNYPY